MSATPTAMLLNKWVKYNGLPDLQEIWQGDVYGPSEHNVTLKFLIFTARCYASAVLAMGLCLSVSVRLSGCVRRTVTSRIYTKTAKHRSTQATPHDTTETLVI